MIQRLTHLNVEGFRVFLEPQDIPLDADVVLVYGPNGTGKTGLISAIEYAITGDVADLSLFADDYAMPKAFSLSGRSKGIAAFHI